jgi:DNA-binding Lrp family transcriptional regulator
MKKKQRKLTLGIKTFTDHETGDVIEVPILHEESADFNFEKIWLGHVLTALEELGSKKIKILSYLFRVREKSNNMVAKTLMEIAKETDTSYPTVSETINLLEDNDLITRKTGVIILNPGMIFKGNHHNRVRIMFEYQSVKKIEVKSNDEVELKAKSKKKLLKGKPDED